MKKIKKPGSLNGLGIAVAIILGIIMIVHVYRTIPDEPFYIRILTGLLSCLCAFIGAGLIELALFLIVYFSEKIYSELFVQSEDEHRNIMDEFSQIMDVLFVACFMASYVIVFIRPI